MVATYIYRVLWQKFMLSSLSAFLKPFLLVASAPRRQLRVLVEEVLWDEFD